MLLGHDMVSMSNRISTFRKILFYLVKYCKQLEKNPILPPLLNSIIFLNRNATCLLTAYIITWHVTLCIRQRAGLLISAPLSILQSCY